MYKGGEGIGFGLFLIMLFKVLQWMSSRFWLLDRGNNFQSISILRHPSTCDAGLFEELKLTIGVEEN